MEPKYLEQANTNKSTLETLYELISEYPTKLK